MKRLGSNGIQEIKDHKFFDCIDFNEMLKNPKNGPLMPKFDAEESTFKALNLKFFG